MSAGWKLVAWTAVVGVVFVWAVAATWMRIHPWYWAAALTVGEWSVTSIAWIAMFYVLYGPLEDGDA